ncbi:MAG TPA: tetratricopeptide repeat protein [Polyangiaceae bacterium]|nr:tetratricopeptide repeat protein [Polyangiaceae bacterium]
MLDAPAPSISAEASAPEAPSLALDAPAPAPEAPVAALETAPESPPSGDSVEGMAAPTSAELETGSSPADEEFTSTDVRGNVRRNWLVAAAVLGLVGAAALGLALTRALNASSTAPTKAAARAAASAAAAPGPAPAAKTTVSEPSVTPGAMLPQAPAQPSAPASSSAIPWDDLPQTAAKSCKALAAVGTGPKTLLAGQAVTRAQRALVRGDTLAAHAAFCTAQQLGVVNETVLLGLARVLFIQSDMSAALAAVDQLVQRAPSNKQAFELRGDILIRMGSVDDAQKAWFKAAGATRTSKLLVDNLVRASDADAKTALRSGDLSRADRMLRRGIALTSGDPEQCRRLITVLTKNGNPVAAERWRAYLSTRGG